jgi:NAD(P)H-hydrate epimerase
MGYVSLQRRKNARGRPARHRRIWDPLHAADDECCRPSGDAVLEMLPAGKCVCVFCGSGNNGGDGVAAAYLLLRRGVEVHAWLVGDREKMTPDTRRWSGGSMSWAARCRILRTIRYCRKNCGILIDALFGIGLSRPLRDKALSAARLMNESGLPVIAADIASGVAADTGLSPARPCTPP